MASDRPIFFIGAMVRAILDGRQTQTRRVLNLPTKGEYVRPDMGGWEPTINGGTGVYFRDGTPVPESVGIWNRTTGTCLNATFQVGDRLWVREAWRCNGWASDLATIFYRASEGDGYTAMCEQYPVTGKKPLRVTGTWRPSIHMPRWASRITLLVTDVRVQRLRDISEEDAAAEGVERDSDGWRDYEMPATQCCGNAGDSFRTLWDSINAKRPGCAWADNPWVVAISFTRQGARDVE